MFGFNICFLLSLYLYRRFKPTKMVSMIISSWILLQFLVLDIGFVLFGDSLVFTYGTNILYIADVAFELGFIYLLFLAAVLFSSGWLLLRFDWNNWITRQSTNSGLVFFIMLVYTVDYVSAGSLYAIVVFKTYLIASPMVIGRRLRVSKLFAIFWVLFLVVNFIHHSTEGSRGSSLYPIIFTFLGYIDLGKLLDKKLFLLTSTVLFMVYMAVISAFRTELGRDELGNKSVGVSEVLASTRSFADGYGDENLLAQFIYRGSIGRLFTWSIPVIIDYCKGNDLLMFDGVRNNADIILDPPIFGQYNKSDWVRLGFSQYRLNDIGFDLSEVYSEDLGFLGEGLLRFGYLGVFLYPLIFFGLISFLQLVLALFNDELLSDLLQYITLFVSLKFYVYSSAYFLRFILYSVPVFILLYVILKFFKLYESSLYRSRS